MTPRIRDRVKRGGMHAGRHELARLMANIRLDDRSLHNARMKLLKNIQHQPEAFYHLVEAA